MDQAKPVKIPILPGKDIRNELKKTDFPYREAIGSLLYLTSKTRPDIAFAVNFCSRYVDKPTEDMTSKNKAHTKIPNWNNKTRTTIRKYKQIEINKSILRCRLCRRS